MSENQQSPAANSRPPIRICLLGSEGAGKTCFVAGLAVLSEPSQTCPLSVQPCDHGAAEYLDGLARTLHLHQWPPPTSMTHELNLRVEFDGLSIQLLMLDFPGEDFRVALRQLNTARIDELYHHTVAADALLLLIEPTADLNAAECSNALVERQTAHLRAVSEVWGERHSNTHGDTSVPIDVAVVLTKSDRLDKVRNPREAQDYFRQRAPGLYQRLKKYADELKYFPVSAVGSVDSTGAHIVPARELRPWGYEDIFRWVVQRHKWRLGRRRRRLISTALIGLALLTCIVGVMAGGLRLRSHSTCSRQVAILNDPDLSDVERLDATRGAVCPEAKRKRGEILDAHLKRLRGEIDGASGDQAIDAALDQLTKLSAAEPGMQEAAIKDLIKLAGQNQEAMAHKRARVAFENRHATFGEVADDFLRRFPTSEHAVEVQKWKSETDTRSMTQARESVKRLTALDADTLKTKSDRIFEFVRDHSARLDDGESARMSRAAELARRFAEWNTYQVRLKRSGGFLSAREQGVALWIGGTLTHEYSSPESSKIVHWPREELAFQWRAGQPLKIVLRDYFGVNEDVATIDENGPLALRALSRWQRFLRFEGNWEAYCDTAFVDFEVAGISKDDWESLSDYILPGDKW